MNESKKKEIMTYGYTINT